MKKILLMVMLGLSCSAVEEEQSAAVESTLAKVYKSSRIQQQKEILNILHYVSKTARQTASDAITKIYSAIKNPNEYKENLLTAVQDYIFAVKIIYQHNMHFDTLEDAVQNMCVFLNSVIKAEISDEELQQLKNVINNMNKITDSVVSANTDSVVKHTQFIKQKYNELLQQLNALIRKNLREDLTVSDKEKLSTVLLTLGMNESYMKEAENEIENNSLDVILTMAYFTKVQEMKAAKADIQAGKNMTKDGVTATSDDSALQTEKRYEELGKEVGKANIMWWKINDIRQEFKDTISSALPSLQNQDKMQLRQLFATVAVNVLSRKDAQTAVNDLYAFLDKYISRDHELYKHPVMNAVAVFSRE